MNNCSPCAALFLEAFLGSFERQKQHLSLTKERNYDDCKPQDDPLLVAIQIGVYNVDVTRNTGIKRATFIRY